MSSRNSIAVRDEQEWRDQEEKEFFAAEELKKAEFKRVFKAN